jgi:hypothetical protein
MLPKVKRIITIPIKKEQIHFADQRLRIRNTIALAGPSQTAALLANRQKAASAINRINICH